MEPEASGRPELLPQLRLDELLAELQGRLQAVLATRDRMRGLLEAVVAISSGLGQLAEFIPVGLSDEEIDRIDHWPAGRGLLGLLINDPRPGTRLEWRVPAVTA